MFSQNKIKNKILDCLYPYYTLSIYSYVNYSIALIRFRSQRRDSNSRCLCPDLQGRSHRPLGNSGKCGRKYCQQFYNKPFLLPTARPRRIFYTIDLSLSSSWANHFHQVQNTSYELHTNVSCTKPLFKFSMLHVIEFMVLFA